MPPIITRWSGRLDAAGKLREFVEMEARRVRHAAPVLNSNATSRDFRARRDEGRKAAVIVRRARVQVVRTGDAGGDDLLPCRADALHGVHVVVAHLVGEHRIVWPGDQGDAERAERRQNAVRVFRSASTMLRSACRARCRSERCACAARCRTSPRPRRGC